MFKGNFADLQPALYCSKNSRILQRMLFIFLQSSMGLVLLLSFVPKSLQMLSNDAFDIICVNLGLPSFKPVIPKDWVGTHMWVTERFIWVTK